MKRFTAGLLACSVASTAFAWSDTERGLRDSTTTALIIQMQSEFRKCFEIPWVYRYDCYDDAYFSSARRVADNPDYDLVEDTLAEVGDKIQAVVRANADPVKPPLRKGFKSYQPIKEEARATAKAQVADAIEEAQTVLLRAPDDNGAHFSRIAQALESNKVLLRAALDWIGRLLRFA
ncbi:MAG: hypothetical protein CML68_25235 [Rhodobacteraceae bacterium]|nr:hypothetical protein [Paracoccaceae bacterium]